ncbi:MAG: type II toxin-antitoxin system VapC family toxin [Deltaproteobacteria bacterium]|nr:type II toxin-antitoxin system VapC family toxin [Deltaproteobacteria bacterium]
MITAVDTNVLIDVFAADATYGLRSKEALRRARVDGELVACAVVWAEVTAAFAEGEAARDAMERLGVALGPLGLEAALAAGAAWRGYRARGGRRERVIADFLIGAHALTSADRLLTRDRGFYRASFKGLAVMDPTAV